MELLDMKSEDTVLLLERLGKVAEAMKQTLRNRTPQLDGEKYLTNSDMGRLLHISQRTLQEYRDTGVLPYIKLGGKILYRQSDILAILDANYVKGAELYLPALPRQSIIRW